jgi:hypothetical protein
MASPLPTRRAADLKTVPEEHRWLVRDLWAAQAVGIVGGEPKCCKSFLALDLAVAVASGAPCLRRFPVADKGPVLLFAAEDALHVVRLRLEGICRAANVDFARLDVHVITAVSLRLDLQDDRLRLIDTIAALRPRLLVLDPFVRLHRVDENASGEVAPLLAFLRELQRRFRTAVVLVHHARKGGARARAGQALRGSSEFHAWGDSNLYLRRAHDGRLVLSVEQRAASSIAALGLDLRSAGDALALHISDDKPADPIQEPDLDPADRIVQALGAAHAPVPLAEIREACRIRTARLCKALADLVDAGRVLKADSGYVLAPPVQ